MFRSFTIHHRCMPGGISIPTKIVSGIYGDCLRQAGKGMGIHRKCFGILPFPPYRGMPGGAPIPTDIVSAIYGDLYENAPKMFWEFAVPYRRMCGGVSIPTKIVSAIYRDLPMHVTKCMGMHRKCFSHLPFPTDACREVYRRNCFGNVW